MCYSQKIVDFPIKGTVILPIIRNPIHDGGMTVPHIPHDSNQPHETTIDQFLRKLMDVHSVSIVFCSHFHGFNGKSAGLSMILLEAAGSQGPPMWRISSSSCWHTSELWAMRRYRKMADLTKNPGEYHGEYHISRNWTDLSMLGFPQFSPKCRQN